MTILDYIKKHKDDDFTTFNFTEVDNLIFSLIPYINFTNIIPAFKKNKITLNEAVTLLNKSTHLNRGLFEGNTLKMLNIMANTKRYGDTLMYNYMRVVNNEMQFGALTMKLNNKSIYIAFAGTDSSIIGWEEDFKMAYLYPGASQKYASIYLNKALKLLDKNVLVGGHSKGGNLAISAVMNANIFIRNKIKTIYNNDGPGFLKEQVESHAYKKIQNKIKMFVPVDSIIGMILYHQENYKVVKAKSFNIFQHDAFNWLCDSNSFIEAKQNKRSKKLENKITQKLEELPLDTRIKLVQNIFNVFKNNNITDAKEIKLKKLLTLIKSFNELDNYTKDLLLELLIIIFL